MMELVVGCGGVVQHGQHHHTCLLEYFLGGDKADPIAPGSADMTAATSHDESSSILLTEDRLAFDRKAQTTVAKQDTMQ